MTDTRFHWDTGGWLGLLDHWGHYVGLHRFRWWTRLVCNRYDDLLMGPSERF